jgi:hypothetical protein
MQVVSTRQFNMPSPWLTAQVAHRRPHAGRERISRRPRFAPSPCNPWPRPRPSLHLLPRPDRHIYRLDYWRIQNRPSFRAVLRRLWQADRRSNRILDLGYLSSTHLDLHHGRTCAQLLDCHERNHKPCALYHLVECNRLVFVSSPRASEDV